MLHVDAAVRRRARSASAPGPVNASCRRTASDVRGKGGHGAYPHNAVDAIPATAALILALQNIAARETDPLASVVVTIGTIRRRLSQQRHRRRRRDDRERCARSIRTFATRLDARVRAHRRRRRRRVRRRRECKSCADIRRWSTTSALAEEFRRRTCAQTAQINVDRPTPTMGGEDFAYFAQRVPGLQIRLGVRNEKARCYSLRAQPAVP